MNPPKDPILAAILSVLIPGLGQFYCRQWARGAMFLAGVIFMTLLMPPLGMLLSTGIWIWGIVDAYRIAKVLQGYGPTAEGDIIEIKKLRFPSVDIRPALTLIGIPLGIVIVLVIVMGFVLIRWYGFWNADTPGGTLKSLIENIDSYKAQTGSYPDSLEALIDPSDPIEKRGTLDRWGNPYIYRATETGFELLSAGEDGKPGTKDDIHYHP